MSIERRTLEQIVAAAVEKHLAGAVAAPAPKVQPSSSGGDAAVFSEAVITGDVLAEKINGHRSFQIAPKAVLTPSAYDFIRERGLVWTRGTAATAPANSGGKFIAAVVTAVPQVRTVIEQLVGNWKLDLLESPGTAARTAVSAISRGEAAGVAILTAQPQLAVCLANRSPKVRAAVVNTAGELDRAVEEIGVNVIVVDPTEWGTFPLQQTLARFGQSSPQPPADWDTVSRLW